MTGISTGNVRHRSHGVFDVGISLRGSSGFVTLSIPQDLLPAPGEAPNLAELEQADFVYEDCSPSLSDHFRSDMVRQLTAKKAGAALKQWLRNLDGEVSTPEDVERVQEVKRK